MECVLAPTPIKPEDREAAAEIIAATKKALLKGLEIWTSDRPEALTFGMNLEIREMHTNCVAEIIARHNQIERFFTEVGNKTLGKVCLAGDKLIALLEQRYDITPMIGDDLADRIERVYGRLLEENDAQLVEG
ncbi:MAG: hypothetical protein LUC93_16505 [Planctomycetaceae bacterium]|nr:hypothetical protein [Planctomycetaceae bacterium]